MMSEFIEKMAINLITGFLLMLGIFPSEDEDTTEVRDYGPHRVFTKQARVPLKLAGSIDPDAVLTQLAAYLEHYNALPVSIEFQPYDAKVYICPCGCGTFLYVSIYTDT